MTNEVLQGNCLELLDEVDPVDMSFLDPPFNQGKEYRYFDDNLDEKEYWKFMLDVLKKIYSITVQGGSIYFMQREKNAEWILRSLRKSGWTVQNIIIWKKMASAVPQAYRFNKAYQLIVFATKGKKPKVFNKLRIDYPLAPWQKYPRKNGIYVTDVWDDIRELTSGYFAGDEPIRDYNGKRAHLQQSPVALLLRIILSSTLPGNHVLDPFAGTGTTLVVAKQLLRRFTGIEIDPEYVKIIRNRLSNIRSADNIMKYRKYYRFTENLDSIWPATKTLKRILPQSILDGFE